MAPGPSKEEYDPISKIMENIQKQLYSKEQLEKEITKLNDIKERLKKEQLEREAYRPPFIVIRN